MKFAVGVALLALLNAPLVAHGYLGSPAEDDPNSDVYQGGGDGDVDIDKRTVGDGDDVDMRIVGGEDAFAGEFPWFSSSITGSLCGASLISPNVLLTAAHCYRAFRPGTSSCSCCCC